MGGWHEEEEERKRFLCPLEEKKWGRTLGWGCADNDECILLFVPSHQIYTTSLKSEKIMDSWKALVGQKGKVCSDKLVLK